MRTRFSVPVILLAFAACSALGGVCASHARETAASALEKDLPLFRKAEGWLESINADPVYLRETLNMKGIKHFVEMVNAYLDLYRTYPEEADRERIRGRVTGMYRIVEDPRYYAFIMDASPVRFREDVISFLNSCVLMREFGLDNSVCAGQVPILLPRLKQDFPRRGNNQRMAMTLLLERLGYPLGHVPEDFLASSVLRERQQPGRMSRIDQYGLTHEIFMLTDYGRREPVLTGEDRMYLFQALPELMEISLKDGDIDLLAEWVAAMNFLGLCDHPLTAEAVALIRDSQNPDGSWGRYEVLRDHVALSEGVEYDVDVGKYLHTTEVALWALTHYRACMAKLR